MAKAIMINERDNNATLFGEARAGEIVRVVRESGDLVQEVTAGQRIPVGHKIALRQIRKGEQVVKYGEAIGTTTKTIQQGEHVHVHNVVGLAFPGQPISSGSRPE
jgi:altronate dehydratase small subunit